MDDDDGCYNNDVDRHTPFHDGSKALGALWAAAHLLAQQVSGGEVDEGILGYDLVALCALAWAWPAQDPYDRRLCWVDGSLKETSRELTVLGFFSLVRVLNVVH